MSNYLDTYSSSMSNDFLSNQNIDTTSNFDIQNEGNTTSMKFVSEKDISAGFKIEEEAKRQIIDICSFDFDEAKQDIFSSLNWNDLRVGQVNEMENIVWELINLTSRITVINWLNQLYLDYNKDALFLCTLFHTLSHMEYVDVLPNGPTMAMASLNHEDDRVIGYAIKAFSNWNSKRTVPLMMCNIPKMPWAKKEWIRVLHYIEQNGDDINELHNENDQSYARVDTKTA